MSVQFDRESVQSLWAHKAGRRHVENKSQTSLAQALADNQLTADEYQQLKQAFLKENPQGDFDAFLADALDGQWDGKHIQALKQALELLRHSADTSLSLSFYLNAAQDGYSHVAALTLAKPGSEIYRFVEQADTDKNGRIDRHEQASLKQALDRTAKTSAASQLLSAQLQDPLTTLSYDETSKQVKVWLGGEAPRLNAHYRDVRLDLEFSLRDINGISDEGRGDLSGTAGGRLDFDWNGPLVESLKRALLESTSGWAQANARYLPAGDASGLGPGYVIQLETPKANLPFVGEVGLATRPLVLRADEQGRLYVASPGFGEGARLWAAEKALKKYALPELQKIGVQMQVNRHNGRLYLTPGPIQLRHLPLSARGGAQGELLLGLNGQNTRFSVTASGLQAHFTQVPVQGSSHAQGSQVSADPQSDSLQAHVQVGLNANLLGQLETQVVVKQATAQVHLDRREIEDLQTLPGHARSLLGDQAEGTLEFRGEYRTDTQAHQGQVTGRLELRSRNHANGDQATVFTHFQSQGDTRHQNQGSISIAGTDISYTHQGNTARMRTETGALRYQEGQPLRVQLFNAQGEAQVNQETLRFFQRILNQGGDRAQQLAAAMQAAGISPALLDQLSKGDSAQLRQLLKMEHFVEQLKAVQLQLKAQNWSMDFNSQGYRAQGQQMSLTARSATLPGPGSALSLEANTQKIQVDSSNERDVQVQAHKTHLRASAHHQQTEGQFSTELSVQAENLKVSAAYAPITPESLQALQARLQAGDAQLEKALQEVGGLGPQELHALRTQAPAQLAKDPEIRAVLEQLGMNRLFSAEFKQTQAQLKAEAETARGSRLQLEAQTEGLHGIASSDRHAHLEGSHGQLQVEYRDQQGNQAQMQMHLKDVKVRLLPNGTFSVQAPDTRIQSQIQAQLEELRQALGILGGDKLEQLLQSKHPQQARELLQAAGLSAEKAKAITDLLWHPHLQALLRSSEFVYSLKQAQGMDFTLSAQGSLHAEPAQLRLEKAQLQARGHIRTAEGQPLLEAQAELSEGQLVQKQGETHMRAQWAQGRLQARRADGVDFLNLQARAEALQAQLGLEQQLETGPLELQVQARSQLDDAKVAEIRAVLQELKNKVQLRLRALGLSRKQLEQFIQAFGQKQLSQLFSSANPEQLAALSRELGVAPEQVERLVGLLNDQTFSRLADYIYQFTQVLEHAQVQLDIKGSAAQSRLSRNAEGLQARLDELQGAASLQLEGEQGHATVQLQGHQEHLEIQHGSDQIRLEGGSYGTQVQAQAEQANQRLELKGEAQGRGGHYRREGQEVRTHLDEAQAQATVHLQRNGGRTASLEAQARYSSITSRRREDQPEQAEVRITGLQQRAVAELHDHESAQTTRAEAETRVEQLTVNPEQVHLEQTRLKGQVQTEQQSKDSRGQATRAQAQAQAQIDIQTLHSGQSQVTLDQATFSGKARTILERQGRRESTLGVQLKQGQMTDLRAQNGQVHIRAIQADLHADATTPIQTGTIQGHLQVQELQAQEAQLTAKGFTIDQVQGKLQISSQKLGQILSNSLDARRILETIYARWGEQGAPGLFKNETITLELDQASLQGRKGTADALSAPKDLTGRLRFPDLETQLGNAQVQLQFHRLSLSSEGQPPEVEVTGHASFQPKQPEFNQALQRLVNQQLKQLGVNARTEVNFKEGRFQVTIDHALADGVISVRTQGDSIELSIDKAKLFGFISARGLATRLAESQINNYLLDFEREGQTLRLSLHEITDYALHRDNLQIRRLNITPAGHFEVDFAYTDTPQYNAAVRQRDQSQLEQRLFRNPRTGQLRTTAQLKDLVEELEPAVVQKIFREASVEQLGRILNSMGSDRDWLVRERALAGLSPQDYARFPAENRAVMALYLTDTTGLFNHVNSQEKRLLRQLLQSLKKPEADRFMQTLSQDQLTRLVQAIADSDQPLEALTNLVAQVYQELAQPAQRNKLRLALERGLSEAQADLVLNTLRAAYPREFGTLSEYLSRIADPSRLARAVQSLDSRQLQQVFRQATPEQLRRMLSAVDANTVLKKGLAGLTNFSVFSPQNRGIMAAFLSRTHGLFDSVDAQEQAFIRALTQNLRPPQRQALFTALSAEERQRLQAYLNP